MGAGAGKNESRRGRVETVRRSPGSELRQAILEAHNFSAEEACSRIQRLLLRPEVRAAIDETARWGIL